MSDALNTSISNDSPLPGLAGIPAVPSGTAAFQIESLEVRYPTALGEHKYGRHWLEASGPQHSRQRFLRRLLPRDSSAFTMSTLVADKGCLGTTLGGVPCARNKERCTAKYAAAEALLVDSSQYPAISSEARTVNLEFCHQHKRQADLLVSNFNLPMFLY